jgi:hypothetical protein
MKFQNYLQESIEDKGIFKAVFLGGVPGGGKTYTSKIIFPGDIQPRLLSIDYYFEAGSTPEKSKSLVQKQLYTWINSMLPLIIDGTSSKPEVILRRQGILESFGYETGIVYINTNPELAIKRMKQRKRTVPEKLIWDVDSSLKEIKGYLKGKFAWSMEIDNNEGELNNDAILAAYKASSKFFNSPLKNDIGIKNIKELRDKKEKYLSAVYDISRIQQITKSWYGVD